jgi:hypothetical protein
MYEVVKKREKYSCQETNDSFACVTLVWIIFIETVVGPGILASGSSLLLIISSEALQKVSGESLTFFL